MLLETTQLGICPVCGVPIPEDGLLGRYDAPDGWPVLLAECANCSTLVNPR